MSTSDMNDIEDIFRKAAADYPADFNAKHWQALKTKLDQGAAHAAAVRSKQYKKVAGILVLLMMLSGATYWIISGGNNTSEDTRVNTTEISTAPDENLLKKEDGAKSLVVTEKKQLSSNITGASEKPLALAEKASVEKESQSEPAKTLDREKNYSSLEQVKPSSTATKSNGYDIPSETIIVPVEKANSKEINEKNFHTADQTGMLPEKSSALRKEASDMKNVSTLETLETNGEVRDAEQQRLNEAAVQEIPDEEKGKTDQAEQEGGNDAEMPADAEKHPIAVDRASEPERAAPIEKRQEFSERPLLGISFTVGPDLSVLGLGEITRPGYSYGLIMHYNISRRWSVGIGALKTTKRYIGAGYDYNPPKGYWEYATNNVIPEKVSGECALIEIPIDIQYDFLRSGKHKFHASAGVSSYFMQHESYEYTFEEPNPCGSQGWDSDKAEGSHLFNIINFSVGYERDIGRKFSLGLAPYVKVPVKGIGWSQVRFVSIGTNFTLKYNFLTRRSTGL